MIGVSGWFIFQSQFRSKLLSTMQSKVDVATRGTGIQARIGDAQFREGRGMLLSNVSASADGVSIKAHEAFLSMPSTTTDLVAGNVRVTRLDLRHVDVELRVGKQLNLESLAARLRQLVGDRAPSTASFPITVRDSRLRFFDTASGVQKTLSDIDIDVETVVHQGRSLLRYELAARGHDGEHFSVAGFSDPQTKAWNANVQLKSLRLHQSMLALFPCSRPDCLSKVRALSAVVDGQFRLDGILGQGGVGTVEGSGTIGQFTLDHPVLPDSLQNGSANFGVSTEGLIVKHASVRMGQATIRGDEVKVTAGEVPKWTARGSVENFQFDGTPRKMRWMKEGAIEFCQEIRPTGRFDVDFYFEGDKQIRYRDFTANISSLAANFVRFPYPVEGGRGVLRWKGERIEYAVQFPQLNRTVDVRGHLDDPGPLSTWRCKISLPEGKVPYDDTLQFAMDRQGKLGEIARSFQVRNGSFSGSAVFEKFDQSGHIDKKFDVNLYDVAIRHKSFPYPIENIRGKVRTHNLDFHFESLVGSNGIAKVVCNGSWNPQQGLIARYICNSVRLDERLRAALGPHLKDVWDGFRPKGVVDRMVVDMAMPEGATEANVVVDAMLHTQTNGVRSSSVSIFPTWFPYQLNEVAAQVKVGNGDVMVRNFEGKHGRTTVRGQGDGSYSATGWDVRFSELLATALKAEEDFLSALPESLATPIDYMKFDGLLSVKGTMTLAGQYRESPDARQFAASRIEQQQGQRAQRASVQLAAAAQDVTIRSLQPEVSMGWDLEFVMNQAKMVMGIPIENVFGKFRLIGQYDGEDVQCRGDLDIDSLTVYDAQVTSIRGPLWFDNYQALAGGMINGLQQDPGQSEAPSIRGQLYGGEVTIDAAISSDEQGRFALRSNITGAELKQFTQEYSPGLEGVEGKTYAALRLEGDATGSHTCRGSGSVHLRDARIYELPHMVRLLKVLQVKRVNGTAFDSGDIDFTVNGEIIDLNRMELNGDAFSLIGNGQMTTSHDLDLNFYSVVGRNRLNIPLLSELYHRGSQKFMWLKVRGTCQDPKMTTEVLPELNDSIRQLQGQRTISR